MSLVCKRKFMSLCSVPKALDRDGHAGRYASTYIPFAGRVFASGTKFSYPSSIIPQDKSRTIHGVSLPDTFNKGFVKA